LPTNYKENTEISIIGWNCQAIPSKILATCPMETFLNDKKIKKKLQNISRITTYTAKTTTTTTTTTTTVDRSNNDNKETVKTATKTKFG